MHIKSTDASGIAKILVKVNLNISLPTNPKNIKKNIIAGESNEIS